MTDSVKPDLLETAELTETGGWASSVTRTFFLQGVTGTSVGTVLYNALTDASLPKAGDELSAQFANMRVATRKAQIITPRPGESKADVKVTIDYESGPLSISDGAYIPPLDPSMFYSIPLRGGANLSQITTGKYRSGGIIDGRYTDTSTNTSKGYKVKFDVYDIHGTFTRETVEFTNDPDSIVYEWINKVNQDTFRGKDPLTWLCTDVQYELASQWRNPMMYRFTWQFEFKPTKWIYESFYTDDKGEIPNDVGTVIDTLENGVTTLWWHEEKDFNEKFRYP